MAFLPPVKIGVKEHTNWIKAVAWNRLAEIAGEYLNKGDRVAIVGSLRQNILGVTQ